MHMPWQEGDQSHVCILSISIVSPLSRIFLLYFRVILILYVCSSVFLSLWEHGRRKIAIILDRRTIVSVMGYFVTSIHKSIGGC
jgi:hypothetical protein